MSAAAALPGWRQWLFAAKICGAALLALWIALWIDLPRPYWAMATVYITTQALAGATRSKAAYRVGGTLIGVAVAVVLVPNLVNAPELLTLALGLWTAACLYLSLLDRTPRSYLFMLAGYTAALIGFPAVTDPAAIFDTAVARAEEITLGILCAALVSGLVLPEPVGPVVAARIQAWLEEAGRWTADVLSGAGEEPAVRARRLRLAAEAAEIDVLATHLSYDTSAQARAAPWVRLLRGRMLILLPVLSSLADRIGALRGLSALPADLRDLLGDVAAWSGAGARPEEGRALLARIDAADASLPAEAGWAAIVRASLIERLRELVEVVRDCRVLEEHVARGGGRLRQELAFASEFGARAPRHRDHGMALRSALGVLVSVTVCVAVWVATAWPDGATAAMMGAVLCCLFAGLDDPVPPILSFATWSVVGSLAVGVLLFGILPLVHDFVTLALVLAPPLLLCGLLMTIPRTMPVGLALGVNGNALLAIQDRYTSEFSGFVNSSLALVGGIWIAALVTRLIRSVGAEQGAWRLLRASRASLARAARRRGRGDRVAFASLMLDRLGLLVPRLAAAGPDSPLRRIDTLAALRVGMNLVSLRRARHGLPRDQVAAVDAALDAVAAHYSGAAGTPAEALLARIDAAMRRVGSATGPQGRRDALLGLAGLRRALFPAAPPYRPGPAGATRLTEAA
ncbi:p-hydroxybenzoic acid efflux pump subunit AaeB [Methylobacterium crusticola]|uniref:p-hydroxybenzoic acid efflux pump subunit AaeB n=1 Tax=Methylobacterium crusticola TaxID=1697972 RepID=A0ABQ4QQ95_9HYPH|nr:FUSC family protein [Methylobacterium crusticola]GJD47414.1 p-hydroxybenzoic acid efflux pump subunit AaeB [Methylobacterium crusticola]